MAHDQNSNPIVNLIVTTRFGDYFFNQLKVTFGVLVLFFILHLFTQGVGNPSVNLLLIYFVWIYWLVSIVGYVVGILSVPKEKND